MLAVYIHIPFCKQKCKYCDFNSHPGLESFYQAYIDALAGEISFQASKLDSPDVKSIYMGGGTPTLLDTAHIDAILGAVGRYFSVARDIEVSVEANPETVSLDKLTSIRKAGVNRLSIGFQSLDDEYLRLLGRKHSAEQAVKAFRLAREAGFDNINVDLIFGIPGQSLANWALTLEQAVSLGPEHLSCYGLTIEPGTVLEREIANGLIENPDEDLQADMLVYTMESLEESGFEHYEISNYAKPGRQCAHNLTYWSGGDYVGFGAGAHSKIESRRFSNIAGPQKYIENAGTDSCVADTIDLSLQDEMSEMLFLGLRKTEGISSEEFKARFGKPVQAVFKDEINDLVRDGLVIQDGRLRLTKKGILFGNEVFSKFL